ncbi:MAG: protease complex subunit PrcB family protein [Candidatus Pacebacteria bacterium]|nr:protease complex subunit PrcB family protein [Candidatus Paceibacterota bacterium]
MRDLLIIMGMCVVAIVIGAWLYLYGPSSSVVEQPGQMQESDTLSTQQASAGASRPQATKVTFSVIGHGSSAQEVTARKNYAVYTEDEFAKVWKMTGSTEEMPVIDFTKAYVIAVFAGTKPTGGYAISVEGVSDVGDVRSVSILSEKPGVGCITTQAITSPYQIIRVPFSGATISRVDVEKEVPCPSR